MPTAQAHLKSLGVNPCHRGGIFLTLLPTSHHPHRVKATSSGEGKDRSIGLEEVFTTLNPLNPKPQTLNPKPQTLNPKPLRGWLWARLAPEVGDGATLGILELVPAGLRESFGF